MEKILLKEAESIKKKIATKIWKTRIKNGTFI
jgi:hypothetical protein